MSRATGAGRRGRTVPRTPWADAAGDAALSELAAVEHPAAVQPRDIAAQLERLRALIEDAGLSTRLRASLLPPLGSLQQACSEADAHAGPDEPAERGGARPTTDLPPGRRP